MMRPSLPLAFLTVALFVVLHPLHAWAVVRTWANPAGGSADVAGNWSPAGIPTGSDNMVFNLAGVYAVTWPAATIPQVISHVYRSSGVVTLSVNGTHEATSSFSVGQLAGDNSALIFNRGTIKADGSFLGTAAGSYGRLTMTSSGFPSTPSFFETTDSTQGVNWGIDGKARAEMLGGAQFKVTGAGALLANTAASLCTLNVAGRNAFAFQNSGFLISNRLRNMIVGASGQADVSIDNGGFIRVAGNTFLGQNAGGVGNVRMGWAGLLLGSHFYCEKELHIGDNGISTQPAGRGLLHLHDKATLHVGGALILGDPNGCAAANLVIDNNSQVILSNGFVIHPQPFTSLIHSGGVFHMRGGTFGWPVNEPLTISSSSARPEVWFSNEIFNQVSSSAGGTVALTVGRHGLGMLRVTRPNTRLNVAVGNSVVAEGASGFGDIVVDSLGEFEVNNSFDLGLDGLGTLTLAHGGRATVGTTTVARNPGSWGNISVMGPLSIMLVANRFDVGGSSSGTGGQAVLVVDSTAVVDVGGAAPLIRIHALSRAEIGRGADMRVAGPLEIAGLVRLIDGTARGATAVQLESNGTIDGEGTVVGTVTSAGIISPFNSTNPDSIPDAIGSIRIQGGYNQFPSATYFATVGHSGAPHCDTLKVDGQVLLGGGTLAIHTDPSFINVPGDTFTVLMGASVSGTFSNVTFNGNPLTGQAIVLYEPTRVRLVFPTGTVGVTPGVDATAALRFAPLGGQSSLTFALDLPAAADARVTLHDVTGREVARLNDGWLGAGRHRLSVGAARGSLASGVYFAQAIVRTGEATVVRKSRAVWMR